MRNVLFCLLVVGCGGAAGDGAPPPKKTVEPELGADDRLVATVTRFADEYCKCTDHGCQARVTERMGEWGAKNKVKENKVPMKRLEPDIVRMMECSIPAPVTSKPEKPDVPRLTLADWQPGGWAIGVPACDRYIDKYMQCVKDRVPDHARDDMVLELQDDIARLKKDVATPDGRRLAQEYCDDADEAWADGMIGFGCTWRPSG